MGWVGDSTEIVIMISSQSSPYLNAFTHHYAVFPSFLRFIVSFLVSTPRWGVVGPYQPVFKYLSSNHLSITIKASFWPSCTSISSTIEIDHSCHSRLCWCNNAHADTFFSRLFFLSNRRIKLAANSTFTYLDLSPSLHTPNANIQTGWSSKSMK